MPTRPNPFENPTPISNFVQMLSIFLIPSALIICFGKIVNARKHAWTLFAVMSFFVRCLNKLFPFWQKIKKIQSMDLVL